MRKNRLSFLLEQDEPNQTAAPEAKLAPKKVSKSAKASDDSADDQIDGLILKYEEASIKEEDGPVTLAESLAAKSLKFLFEQEEEEAEEEPAEDEGEDSPAGSEDMDVSEPADIEKLPNLDVDAFATRVARLIRNHRNLLNLEEVILNRAKNFLDENYGDVFVNKFLDSLESDHGIGAEEFPGVEYSQDDVFGIGANPAGSGITGGGG